MPPSLTNQNRVEIEYIDGSKTKISLKSQLTIRELYTFIKHIGGNDTPSLVALCAGQPIEWIDKLKLTSYTKLSSECVRLNFRDAMEIVQNDPIAAAQMGDFLTNLHRTIKDLTPEEIAQIQKVSDGMNTSPNSAGKSPEPPQSESVEETGSVS